MLSYRHGFHAGNFADVMKHAGLLALVRRLTEKPRGLCFVDTHAGAGSYDLAHDFARKTGEWRAGVGRILAAPAAAEPALAEYATLVGRGLAGEDGGAPRYPGSPEILRTLLREQDRLILCELHGTEVDALRHWAGKDVRVQVHARDGFEALAALLPLAPPGPRAGLALIDPSYEVKADYDRLPRAVAATIRRWAEGCILVWYPILANVVPEAMVAALVQAHPRGALDWRLHDDRPRAGRPGMTGAGLILLNPPWGLEASWRALGEALPPVLFDGAGRSVLTAFPAA